MKAARPPSAGERGAPARRSGGAEVPEGTAARGGIHEAGLHARHDLRLGPGPQDALAVLVARAGILAEEMHRIPEHAAVVDDVGLEAAVRGVQRRDDLLEEPGVRLPAPVLGVRGEALVREPDRLAVDALRVVEVAHEGHRVLQVARADHLGFEVGGDARVGEEAEALEDEVASVRGLPHAGEDGRGQAHLAQDLQVRPRVGAVRE
mmetsp:Transcript_9844/g.31294  ORF Transcript_9844/g.31294 Transcript_9844/m.31294 type:complete len:206 (-) Transcript_9844:576-1193(-)